MYILSISIGIGEGVGGGIKAYIVIGEDNSCVALVWWVFREVRIAWRVRVDLVQASQF